ncbi:MAG: hypothetical protein GY870_17575 [archaeon]|nr:hypothetical protein [archaeon]
MGKVSLKSVNDYGEFIQINSPDIPTEILLFVEIEIIEDLPDIVILDYFEKNDFKLHFIPPNPRPKSEYQFYEKKINKKIKNIKINK